jgi:hypothetical protein
MVAANVGVVVVVLPPEPPDPPEPPVPPDPPEPPDPLDPLDPELLLELFDPSPDGSVVDLPHAIVRTSAQITSARDFITMSFRQRNVTRFSL